MSAIIGIFYRDGRKIDPEIIKKMNDKLSHRGPDGSAVWCECNVALGHQMLWTTPESLHEKLPFHDEKLGLVITADARIDNRKELSQKLDIEDKEDVSDSYFILKAYEKWGEKCPEHLLGDFAFAIWDENEEKLFCARDHMGVKPFYYYLDDKMFVFGTEIKALHTLSEVPKKLNEYKVALYLLKFLLDYKYTFYENILNLSPSHSLVLNKDSKEMSTYWKLDSNLEIKMNSEEDYVNTFLDIFAEAVKCRLRNYNSLGFELSGGLDSSSIVCMALKIMNENKNQIKSINTFSDIYNEIIECDERYYSKKVANINGIKSHFINMDNISPLENIYGIFHQQDQPFNSPHMTKRIKSLSKAKNENINVLLSGHGGDETLSHGENYIKDLIVTFQLKKLIKELKGLFNHSNKSKYKIIFDEIIFHFIPYFMLKGYRFFFRKNTQSILNKKFLNMLKIDDENYLHKLYTLKHFTSKEYHYFILNIAQHETFGTINRRAANFDIDVRYPFFDKRLIEFCYALPTEMKRNSGWTKFILRIAMKDILPPEIAWRYDKTDLTQSYKRNLFFEKNIIKKIIYHDNKLIKNYVNIKKLQYLYENYESVGTQVYDLWKVVVLYLWLEYSNILC